MHKIAKQAEPDLPVAARRRFVCVHGHFYQPPRENPWLETVEVQDSAAPYHDWNDRVTAECYAPNGASRIVDVNNEIIRIVNNYARMSFNFGPTLLSWLQDNAPRTYRMILDADKTSLQRYSGHGSAMAQVYNHIIMPLASPRDALTQIRWGIADFEFRFGRKPEGMWLSETAVNRAVLDLMAQEGILFTILAPHQCARIRKIPTPSANPCAPQPTQSTSKDPDAEIAEKSNSSATDLCWTETPNATVDTTRAYSVPLDEGRNITVFFYDGPISRAVAFEGLLNSGEAFGDRLLAPLPKFFPGEAARSTLPHRHRRRELRPPPPPRRDGSLLCHALDRRKPSGPPHQLRRIPRHLPAAVAGRGRRRHRLVLLPRHRALALQLRLQRRQARLVPGVARAPPPSLRSPPRRHRPHGRKIVQAPVKDLWVARDAYIEVVLNRARATEFFSRHATHTLSTAERVTALELLELERHTQLMYTSCGWFFDEVSGIESVQVIAYAGRVLQLAAKLFGAPGAALEQQFLAILETAKSNIPEIGTAADVYRRYVTGMKIGLEAVGAHYAISSIFRNYPEDGELFCFDLHRDSHEVFTSGRGRVAIGRALIRSRITEEAETICFAVLHLGDQNLSAAVKRYNPDDARETEAFAKFSTEVGLAIRRANLPEVIRLIDRFFGPRRATDGDTSPTGSTGYSLTSLFADEQHRILKTILNQTISEMEDSLRKIYEDHASLMHFLTESGMAAPPALALAASFAINASLRRAIEAEQFDPVAIETLLDRAANDQITLDASLLSFTAGQRMKRAMVQLEAAAALGTPAAAPLAAAVTVADTLRNMPFEVNLWQAQNIWNDLLRRSDKRYWSEEWKEGFKRLGLALNIAVDRLVIEEGVTAF